MSPAIRKAINQLEDLIEALEQNQVKSFFFVAIAYEGGVATNVFTTTQDGEAGKIELGHEVDKVMVRNHLRSQ